MVARITHIFLHPLFISCIALYALIRYLRGIYYPMPAWVNGYVTDFICMPVILMICLALTRLIKRNQQIEIKAWLIVLICAEYAVLFEWILPKKSAIYTGDWVDVVMYSLGGILFYFIQPMLKFKEKQLSKINN